MILRLVIFFLINFGALALGGLFTTEAVNGAWYLGLQKAPWTPPGWFFGVAWSTIMLCFSFYMAFLWEKVSDKKQLIALFVLQFLLNVLWNPIFFYWQEVIGGLVTITVLTLLVGYFLVKYWRLLKWQSLLILPYFLWLIIATSLNAYILVNN